MDPPYFSQRNYGDFDDTFNDMNDYLDFIRPRLEQCKRVLSETGSIYCHLDWHAVHYVKVMMDEIFGYDNFKNDIIWKRATSKNASINKYNEICDHIILYTKSKHCVFNTQYTNNLKKHLYQIEKETGRLFATSGMTVPGDSPKELMFKDNGLITAPPNKRFRWSQDTYNERLIANPYVIYWTKNGIPRKKHYKDEFKGVPLSNLWDDIHNIKGVYQTQKPEILLERIIKSSSNPGDVVLDPFCGSGTTLAVAQRLDRKWIGIDESEKAIKLSNSRLNGGLNGYI